MPGSARHNLVAINPSTCVENKSDEMEKRGKVNQRRGGKGGRK